jgi:hypothetical protein
MSVLHAMFCPNFRNRVLTRMRSVILSALCLAPWLPSDAAAGKRYALLIGNRTYTENIGHLKNPANDVALVSKALKDVDFEVELPVIDADAKMIRSKVYEFVEKLVAAGPEAVGFFYYVGHGMASSDERTPTNYLLPVTMERTDNKSLRSEAVPLSEITDQLRKATREGANVFVVFDACRNLAGTKGRGKGFVPMEHVGGMHIAFATQSGATASDGEAGSQNGPFALALSTNIRRPGNYQAVYSRVRDAVLRTTNEEQHPLYVDDITTSSLQFLEDRKIIAAWEAMKTTGDPFELLAFAKTYRGTEYAQRAEDRYSELQRKAINAGRAWMKQKGRLGDDRSTQHFSAVPTRYQQRPKEQSNEPRQDDPGIPVWQVINQETMVFIDPNEFKILDSNIRRESGQVSKPLPAGIAGAVFLEVYEVPKSAKSGELVDIKMARLVIDERNGLYAAAVSRAAENAFMFTHGAIDFMRIRLGHGEYFKRNAATFSSLKVFVVDGAENAFFCSQTGSECPFSNSFVIGAGFTEGIDILGHELAHHFLLREANLVFAGESGAVMESFADLFGALIENYYRRGSGSWLIGKSMGGFSESSPLRSMRDPTLKDAQGNSRFNKAAPIADNNRGQPDHYSLLVASKDPICETTGDYFNGCVHFNSGILNKAFYLMAEGGEHYKNVVKGIGARKLERVAYRTVMEKLSPTDGLVETGASLLLSCRDLATAKQFEIGVDDCQQVINALMAVGLYRSTAPN